MSSWGVSPAADSAEAVVQTPCIRPSSPSRRTSYNLKGTPPEPLHQVQDTAILMQTGWPDMRLPILYALSHPARVADSVDCARHDLPRNVRRAPLFLEVICGFEAM